MQHSIGRAVLEVILCALFYAVFCLVVLALAAVFIRAYVPAAGVVTAINWAIKCVGSFLVPVFVIRRERAVIKGAIAGVLGTLVTMLLFGIVGGFSVTPLFLVELLLTALLGALGALAGKKLHRA